VQLTVVPLSQDELARTGTVKGTAPPEQLPTTVWLVPGASVGGIRSALGGHAALDPEHASALSQALPAARQIAPALPGVWTQPATPSHEPTVHGF
jgi:hypothetical protein